MSDTFIEHLKKVNNGRTNNMWGKNKMGIIVFNRGNSYLVDPHSPHRTKNIGTILVKHFYVLRIE